MGLTILYHILPRFRNANNCLATRVTVTRVFFITDSNAQYKLTVP